MSVSVVPIFAPELHRYLLDHPKAELPNREEFSYGATNEFDLKPRTRVNHVVISACYFANAFEVRPVRACIASWNTLKRRWSIS